MLNNTSPECLPSCEVTCSQPCAYSRNLEPCVASCGDSRALVFAPPVVLTFPGPTLSSCSQESIVGTSFPPFLGALASNGSDESYGMGGPFGSEDVSGMGGSFGFGGMSGMQSPFGPGGSCGYDGVPGMKGSFGSGGSCGYGMKGSFGSRGSCGYGMKGSFGSEASFGSGGFCGYGGVPGMKGSFGSGASFGSGGSPGMGYSRRFYSTRRGSRLENSS